MSFGEKLRQAREENELTQKQLGELIGKTHDQISQLERGVRNPSLKELTNLCDLLNKTEDYFYPPDEPKPKLRKGNESWFNKRQKKEKPIQDIKDNNFKNKRRPFINHTAIAYYENLQKKKEEEKAKDYVDEETRNKLDSIVEEIYKEDESTAENEAVITNDEPEEELEELENTIEQEIATDKEDEPVVINEPIVRSEPVVIDKPIIIKDTTPPKQITKKVITITIPQNGDIQIKIEEQ